MTRPLSLRPHYFATPFEDRHGLIETARERLEDVDFDTIVVTGVSGLVAGSLVANALDKHLLVVRKEDDTSTHSSRRIEGFLGARWLFLDDFTDSGSTLRRVQEAVTAVAARPLPWAEEADPHETTYVGAYLYNRTRGYYAPGKEMERDW